MEFALSMAFGDTMSTTIFSGIGDEGMLKRCQAPARCECQRRSRPAASCSNSYHEVKSVYVASGSQHDNMVRLPARFARPLLVQNFRHPSPPTSCLLAISRISSLGSTQAVVPSCNTSVPNFFSQKSVNALISLSLSACKLATSCSFRSLSFSMYPRAASSPCGQTAWKTSLSSTFPYQALALS